MAQKATSLAEFYPLEALAKNLGVTKAVIYRWRDDLGLPFVKVGSKTFFHEPAVAEWLQGLEERKATSEDEQ